MPRERITDILARLAESGAVELHVTLLVAGVQVEGLLTSTLRFDRWVAVNLKIIAAAGTGPMPLETVGPPDKEEREAIQRRYDDQHKEDEESSFEEICLRSAQVQSGMPMTWRTYPFLLINADHVDAITLGGSSSPASPRERDG